MFKHKPDAVFGGWLQIMLLGRHRFPSLINNKCHSEIPANAG
jgi:hypothetical protein